MMGEAGAAHRRVGRRCVLAVMPFGWRLLVLWLLWAAIGMSSPCLDSQQAAHPVRR